MLLVEPLVLLQIPGQVRCVHLPESRGHHDGSGLGGSTMMTAVIVLVLVLVLMLVSRSQRMTRVANGGPGNENTFKQPHDVKKKIKTSRAHNSEALA